MKLTRRALPWLAAPTLLPGLVPILVPALVPTLVPAAALAQAAWPNRPVRIVVPFPPGGSTDVLARRLADRLSQALGQTFLVENRAGAGGTTGADHVSKAAADGHTLLMGVTGSNAIAQSLYANLPYDTVRGFAPVARMLSAPLVLVVTPSLPVRDLAGYVAASRTGTMNYATPGNGTAMHLTAVMFAQAAGVALTHIPYRGSAQLMVDLVAGTVASAFADLLVVLPQIAAGTVHAVAVTGTTRHPLLPEVPTVAEAGLPGFQAISWQGLFAPPATPAALLEQIHAAFARAMQTEEIGPFFARQGFTVETTTPAEFAAFVAAETVRWGAVVRAANLRLD